MEKREIKFRAWQHDPEEVGGYKHMHTPCPMAWLDDSLCSDWTFMQFTGLRDRSGTEIYEGDVVRFHWNGECDTGRIEYDGGSFFCTVNAKRVFASPGGVAYMLFDLNPDEMEVIGNIYENPELVKQPA